MLTNPRARQDAGDISLVPIDRRVSGPGASYVVAPFVHVSEDRPSRFTNGSQYGVFYAAQNFETALFEVAHHRGKFHQATNDNPLRTEERVLVGNIDARLHDIRETNWKHLHNPNDYSDSQAFGQNIRNNGSDGIVYNSVRKPGGECFATFWPDVMEIPIQTKHIGYHWNGSEIDKYFDYQSGNWTNLSDIA